jgi:hypothetical protein
MKAKAFTQSISDLQLEMIETRLNVARIVGVSDDKLEQMMVDAGLDWLDLVTQNSPAASNIARMKEFWGFWKKTWHKTDLEFLKLVRTWDIRSFKLIYYYEYLHRISHDNPHLNNTSVNCDYHMLLRMVKSH